MKLTVTITFILFLLNFSLCQEGIEEDSVNIESTANKTITKSDLNGTWRACGDAN
jgi:hypothetical protein